MRTVIITGGNIEEDFALSFLKQWQPSCLLAVDGGLAFCYVNRLRPDCIMGDFDSVAPEVIQWYRSQGGIPIREYNPVKDATDTCIALDYAMEQGSSEIAILGGTGTRLDHVLCNIQILKRAYVKGVSAFLLDSHNRIQLPVQKDFTIEKDRQYGTYVSFFPLGEEVEGLTLEGFKYPLDHYRLRNLEGLGVSNEITAGIAHVSWEAGILVMIESRD
ncbi:MAG TPA: thiamine diphosphokinase [Candidatus Pullilachnospira intestinigallinarum]|nr:thiamine diphosphokinase [Candidatus Pullilachnospira intestinigallinarum]